MIATVFGLLLVYTKRRNCKRFTSDRAALEIRRASRPTGQVRTTGVLQPSARSRANGRQAGSNGANRFFWRLLPACPLTVRNRTAIGRSIGHHQIGKRGVTGNVDPTLCFEWISSSKDIYVGKPIRRSRIWKRGSGRSRSSSKSDWRGKAKPKDFSE